MRRLGGDPEIPISLVSGFESVAIMRGGKAETPHYLDIIAPITEHSLAREFGATPIQHLP